VLSRGALTSQEEMQFQITDFFFNLGHRVLKIELKLAIKVQNGGGINE
jgi:hypothetical protein